MSKLKGQLVLVTGATGFVGSHLTRKLLNLGAKVRILVRESSNKDLVSELKALGAEVVYGDVTDREAVFSAVSGTAYVFHIAALFREAKHGDSVYYDVNVEGTRNVLDACEKYDVKRLAHCSTIGVHSHIPNPPADENEPFRPADIYQVTKCEGEKLVSAYMKADRVNAAIIRPAMIWGDGDKRILKLFKGVSTKKLPIIGDGQTWTHWVYVHDLVNGFILAAEKDEAKGQTYIFAGKRPLAIKDLYKLIAKKAGVNLLPFRIPALPLQILGGLTELVCIPFGIEPPLYRRRVDFFTKHRSFDISKARNELGYEPENDIEEEVEKIYNWYQNKGWL